MMKRTLPALKRRPKAGAVTSKGRSGGGVGRKTRRQPPLWTQQTTMTVDNEVIFVVRYATSRIYIVGTNHIDGRYVLIVQKLLKRVRPQVVGVELCRTRTGFKHLMAGDEAQWRQSGPHPAAGLPAEFRFERVPAQWRRAAVGEKLSLLYAYGAVRYAESKSFRVELQRYRALRTYKLRPPTRLDDSTRIGAELVAPFRDFVWRSDGADSVYLSNTCTRYRILLLDRPVQQTYAAIADALTEHERLLVKNYKANFETEFVARRERNKPSIMSGLMLAADAKLRHIFVQQRDAHMARTMFGELLQHRIPKMVCVIGRTHVSGVLLELRKLSAQAAKRS